MKKKLTLKKVLLSQLDEHQMKDLTGGYEISGLLICPSQMAPTHVHYCKSIVIACPPPPTKPHISDVGACISINVSCNPTGPHCA